MITAKQAPYRRHGTPWHRPHLLNLDDLQIIAAYGAEYRGIAQYYLLAGNVFRLHRLRRAAELSMLKTLAAKHRSTVATMARKYRAVIVTSHGPRTCFEARLERPGRKPLTARFGGIPLKRQTKAVLTDRQPAPPARPKEIITRLLHGQCEWCGRRVTVETHQVRKLADLASQPGREQAAWAAQMAKMRRKTLIVCTPCHQAIHHGKPAANCTAPRRRPTGVTPDSARPSQTSSDIKVALKCGMATACPTRKRAQEGQPVLGRTTKPMSPRFQGNPGNRTQRDAARRNHAAWHAEGQGFESP